jgi:hypothetical protein
MPPSVVNRIDGELRTPKANVGNIEWDQRFSRRFLLKVAASPRKASVSTS